MSSKMSQNVLPVPYNGVRQFTSNSFGTQEKQVMHKAINISINGLFSGPPLIYLRVLFDRSEALSVTSTRSLDQLCAKNWEQLVLVIMP